MKEVNDAESCQKHCQELLACKFWTYNANKKVCRRQTEKAPTAVGTCDHCTRGPKYCQGNMGTMELSFILSFYLLCLFQNFVSRNPSI